MERVTLDVEHLEYMLECPVCMDQYTDAKPPKALPCQHTMCLWCLVALGGGASGCLVCPKCRASHAIPSGGMKAFPNNLMAMDLMALKVELSCRVDGCEERGTFKRCFHCQEKICDNHLKEHSKETQRKIQTTLNDIKMQVETYEHVIARVKELLQQSETDASELKATVTSTMDSLINELVLRKEIMLSEVDDHITGVRQTYRKIERDMKQIAKSETEYCESKSFLLTKDILLSSDGTEDVETEAKTRADSLRQKSPSYCVDRFTFSCKFNPSDMRRLVEQIQSFGKLRLDREQVDITPPEVSIYAGASMTKEEYIAKGRCLMNIKGFEVDKQFVKWKPLGVTVCPKTDDVIVTCHCYPCIYLLSPELGYVRSFGSKGSMPGRFESPRGVTVNAKEELVICDSKNSRLQVVTKAGETIRMVTWPGEMSDPSDVALGSAGIIYVTDTYSDQILVFDAAGQPLRKLGTPGSFSELFSIAVNKDILAVSETAWGQNKIQMLLSDGSPVHVISKGAGGKAWKPLGVCTDLSGHVLLVDVSDKCVKVYNTQGQFQCQFSMSDFKSSGAFLFSFIALTKGGRLLVTNSYTHSLLVY